MCFPLRRYCQVHCCSQAVEQSSESEAGSGGGGGYLPTSMGLVANKGARNRGRYCSQAADGLRTYCGGCSTWSRKE